MRIFIGHDSRYPQATDVCEKSMKNFNSKLSVTRLDKKKLKDSGLYERVDVSGESTEFSFTRFYVPLLCDYEGIAMFCDNDFLWRCDPSEMLEYLGDNDIAVVKHPEYASRSTKMDGIQNKTYPRKNWSSLIIFNCSKLKHLNKEYLDHASASDLHELKWADTIGEIPRTYNCLVGHYGCNNAKALHYTNGGPWFKEYKNSEKSIAWWTIYESL